jgi:hypothetical protein
MGSNDGVHLHMAMGDTMVAFKDIINYSTINSILRRNQEIP